MYSKMDNIQDLGMEWEEVEYLAKELGKRKYALREVSHQLVFERKVLGFFNGPEYRVTLVKWAMTVDAWNGKRQEELWSLTNIAQITGMLKLLIGMLDEELLLKTRSLT